MSVRTPRTKSRWFAKQKERDPAAIASVVGMAVWRLGLHSIKRMRSARFEIEASPQYFAFLREYLIFLVQVADRFALARLTLPERRVFTVNLAKQIARLVAENESELLGGDHDAMRSRFLDTFNERADAYAECSFAEDSGPGFDFVRLCSHLLLDVMTEQDRAWLIDQIMSIEAPEAVDRLRQVIDNLVRTAGAIVSHEEPEQDGPFPEMPAVDAPVDDPIPPE
ncbi:MAG: hypothetical protein JSW31_00485 [Burkholderiales bacterium]|nr:MAG: hypothetical protein JSW31_00485 [Burkholderiales bacterium]